MDPVYVEIKSGVPQRGKDVYGCLLSSCGVLFYASLDKEKKEIIDFDQIEIKQDMWTSGRTCLFFLPLSNACVFIDFARKVTRSDTIMKALKDAIVQTNALELQLWVQDDVVYIFYKTVSAAPPTASPPAPLRRCTYAHIYIYLILSYLISSYLILSHSIL
jgi:hypothetical protein